MQLLIRNRPGWFNGYFPASRFDNFLDDFQGNLLEMRLALEHRRASFNSPAPYPAGNHTSEIFCASFGSPVAFRTPA
jgi:hypothetical protein